MSVFCSNTFISASESWKCNLRGSCHISNFFFQKVIPLVFTSCTFATNFFLLYLLQSFCRQLKILLKTLEVQYVPSHTQHLADMMSRSYLPTAKIPIARLKGWVPSNSFLCVEKFRLETKKDNTLQVLKTTILKAWPEDKSKVPPLVTPNYNVRDKLSIYDGLVFRGEWLVVPQGLRADEKRELHASHAGVYVDIRT